MKEKWGVEQKRIKKGHHKNLGKWSEKSFESTAKSTKWYMQNVDNGIQKR